MRLRNLSIDRRDHGGNGNTDKWYAVTPVYLSANDRDTAAALAEEVITFAGQSPPAGATPQRPLLFGPEEGAHCFFVDTEIAGKAAVTFWDTDRTAFEISSRRTSTEPRRVVTP